MLNKILVMLTAVAAVICLIAFVEGDDSYAVDTASAQTQSVADEKIEIVVRDDNSLPKMVNIAAGIALIGGACAVCGFCVHELRKERFSPFGMK